MCEDVGSLEGARSQPPKAMPRKRRKKKTFSATKAVREMARERVGSPKPSRPVPAKNTKPEKHKATLGKLLQEE
jgi:hypothetical protein